MAGVRLGSVHVHCIEPVNILVLHRITQPWKWILPLAPFGAGREDSIKAI